MIPVFDILRQHKSIKKELSNAFHRVLNSGWYILGKEVEMFEYAFAEYNGVQHCVGVASGTEALYLALRALDVGTGDEVITVSHTAVATVAAIVLTGATPRFVDICEDSFTMNVTQLENAITKRTKAIVPVHLYGLAANLGPLLDVASHYKIDIIEDCAQAHGALYQGKKVGSFGAMGAFSFYPTKNLGCIGDGGAVVTNNSKLAEKLRLLRQYGWKERYVSSAEGINSRLDELQAAFLRAKLPYLDKWNDTRRQIARMYKEHLQHVKIPDEPIDKKHVYHLYVISCSNRDFLMAHLAEQQIFTSIHYPVPVHMQGAYKAFSPKGGLPVTEKIIGNILSLPMYPELTRDEVLIVSDTINGFYESRSGVNINEA